MFDTFFTQVNKRHNCNTRSASNMFYTLPKVTTSYGIFNIRFKSPKVWNSMISEHLKTFPISNFKESVKIKIISYLFLLAVVLFSFVSFCHLSKSFFYILIYCLFLVAIAIVCSSYINVFFMYCLKHEQQCFIGFKNTRRSRVFLNPIKHVLRVF